MAGVARNGNNRRITALDFAIDKFSERWRGHTRGGVRVYEGNDFRRASFVGVQFQPVP